MNGIAWGLLVLFVLLDMFFSVVRAALLNTRLPQLIETGSKDETRLERTITILERPRLRAALRLSIALQHAAVLGCAWWLVANASLAFSLGAQLGVFVAILIGLVMLEFFIERFPLRNPENWTMSLAPVAKAVDILCKPLTAALVLLQGTNSQLQHNLGVVTEDELKTWADVGESEGGLEPGERKMIYSIFQFSETLCREIMIPRTEVLALDVKTPLAIAINTMVDSGHSRVPVYEGVIDNVIGLLYAKDLLKLHTNTSDKGSIRKFLRKAYFVPESKKVDDLLAEMQAKGVHIAIIVDEYGGMAGLVTLEDIVEEIVGEIRDEYDQSEELLLQEINEDEFIFMGRVSMYDFNDALSTNLETDQTDTLGGFFYGEMGRVPLEGDELFVGGWKLTVEEVRGRRVGRIRAVRLKPEQAEEKENAART